MAIIIGNSPKVLCCFATFKRIFVPDLLVRIRALNPTDSSVIPTETVL